MVFPHRLPGFLAVMAGLVMLTACELVGQSVLLPVPAVQGSPSGMPVFAISGVTSEAHQYRTDERIENPASAGARLPRLVALPNGGVLMSWVESASGRHSLRFAVFHDGRWSQQGEVAQGEDWFINWTDFPSVVAIDQSFWVAHWLVKHPGGRSYDYDIAISLSTDAGRTWSKSKVLHQDGAVAEHGFATLFPVNGDAGVIWLDGGVMSGKRNRGCITVMLPIAGIQKNPVIFHCATHVFTVMVR